jgi:hypothetical protein
MFKGNYSFNNELEILDLEYSLNFLKKFNKIYLFKNFFKNSMGKLKLLSKNIYKKKFLNFF